MISAHAYDTDRPDLIFLAVISLLFSAIIVLSGCATHSPSSFSSANQKSTFERSRLADSAKRTAEIGTSPPTTDERKLHHEARIELLITNLRSAIQQITAWVEAQKGYVEHIDNERIIVQVPAGEFAASVAHVLALGKVIHKEIITLDITDAYRATELRLRIANATRKRLMDLLEKAQSEEDKLGLLKQIETVSAEIQFLTAQFELLKTKVEFSKITILLKTRNDISSGHFEPASLAWLNQLSPLDDTVARDSARLAFAPPHGMLPVTADRKYWTAESGDKVMMRAFQRDNHPEGDTAFWRQAATLRLTPKYRSVETIEAGGFTLLRLVSHDDTPHSYYVGIKVDGARLKVVECYFPTTELESRYQEAIFASLREGTK